MAAIIINETVLEYAAQLVIMDAIENGAKNVNDIASWIRTKHFENLVIEYSKQVLHLKNILDKSN